MPRSYIGRALHLFLYLRYCLVFNADGAYQSLQLASPNPNLAMKPIRAMRVVPRLPSQLKVVFSKSHISQL